MPGLPAPAGVLPGRLRLLLSRSRVLEGLMPRLHRIVIALAVLQLGLSVTAVWLAWDRLRGFRPAAVATWLEKGIPQKVTGPAAPPPPAAPPKPQKRPPAE
jgi:hypothetical protein